MEYFLHKVSVALSLTPLSAVGIEPNVPIVDAPSAHDIDLQAAGTWSAGSSPKQLRSPGRGQYTGVIRHSI